MSPETIRFIGNKIFWTFWTKLREHHGLLGLHGLDFRLSAATCLLGLFGCLLCAFLLEICKNQIHVRKISVLVRNRCS
jgi:hypothetical protein